MPKKFFILFIILTFIFPVLSLKIKAASAPNLNYQSGQILVKLKNTEKIFKFKFSPQDNLEELLNFYNSNPQVEYAEPNYLYSASLIPSDTYFNYQGYLNKIHAPEAWNITTGSRNIIVAVIDSGVYIDHPDLKNNIFINSQEIPNNKIDDDENGFTDDVSGWDFVVDSSDPNPKLNGDYSIAGINHGTVVAGIISAQGNNSDGIAGISWQTKILPLRVLNGAGVGDTLTVAKAIDYARLMKVDIINLSFVGSGKSLTLETAIKKAANAGILIVSAAGNEVASGVDLELTPQYPVCHDGPNGENWVIGVASVDDYNQLASFSNYGKNCIDLTTPGLGITSTVFNNNSREFNDYYKKGWAGTSVSAPQVSGALALIKSLKPDLNNQQTTDILLNSTDDIYEFNPQYSNQLGTGNLNIFNAISKTISAQPAAETGSKLILTTPAQTGGPHVKIYKKTTLENSFFVHEEKTNTSVSLAMGKIDDSSNKKIIVGLGKNNFPWVKIYNLDGSLNNKIIAYAENFRGGIEIALADIDGDGINEIITGAGEGGGPHVRIFNNAGVVLGQFFAFDKNNRVGINLISYDVNFDGKDEIIIWQKKNSNKIKIFNASGELLQTLEISDLNTRNGFSLACTDLNNDNTIEYIVGSGKNNSPKILIYNTQGKLIKEFLAYHPNFKGGIFVASQDVNQDNLPEIIVGAGSGGGPHLRVFDAQGNSQFSFFAYDENFRGGIKVFTEK